VTRTVFVLVAVFAVCAMGAVTGAGLERSQAALSDVESLNLNVSAEATGEALAVQPETDSHRDQSARLGPESAAGSEPGPAATERPPGTDVPGRNGTQLQADGPDNSTTAGPAYENASTGGGGTGAGTGTVNHTTTPTTNHTTSSTADPEPPDTSNRAPSATAEPTSGSGDGDNDTSDGSEDGTEAAAAPEFDGDTDADTDTDTDTDAAVVD
jgi:hypothetical protein